MLTIEQIYNNKLEYLQHLSKLGIDLTRLSNYLDSNRVDFFNKPYNVYPTGAYAGALCEHSLKVLKNLTELCQKYAPNEYSEEDLIKVALFKDLYRAELFELYNKNQKNETTGQWEVVPAYRTKEERPVFGDIGFSSYMIAKKFVSLDNDDVVEAICQASLNNSIDSYVIRANYKLVTLTIMAELIINYLGEV